MKARIDGSGRVVIPARIRRELGIGRDGGEVELLDTPDGVLLRPLGGPIPQRNEHGMLVVAIGHEVTADEVASAIDEDRQRADA